MFWIVSCSNVKSGERAVFFEHYEKEHLFMTFEVNGHENLINFYSLLKGKGVQVGNIEDRALRETILSSLILTELNLMFGVS